MVLDRNFEIVYTYYRAMKARFFYERKGCLCFNIVGHGLLWR
ncbi:hypothetical protein FACS1894137_12800 [Spirochaetia bacterium]|nr:hypothetical protein FACS1894137_12800 [Spirochaetia bacterium]